MLVIDPEYPCAELTSNRADTATAIPTAPLVRVRRAKVALPEAERSMINPPSSTFPTDASILMRQRLARPKGAGPHRDTGSIPVGASSSAPGLQIPGPALLGGPINLLV